MSILSAFLGASAGSGGLTATASPPSFSGGSTATFPMPRTFGPCVALPAGGSGSYTYSWTVVSTNTSASFSAPAAQSTNITVGGLYADTSYSILRCTVTDAETGATARVDVLVQYTHRDIVSG